VGNVQLQLGQQVVGALELRFAFPWEANDHIGGNGRCGDDLADAPYQAAIVLGSVTALHRLQHLVVAGLHRHLDMRHNLRQLSYRLQ